MSAERSLGSVRQALAPVNTPLGATVKYNPHLWGDDELRAIFVVRQPELAALLDAVRRTSAKSVPQHRLIVGQRGMGKTTLLRRLALAIRDDADLSRDWLALTFPEEQYTVSTLGELWRNVLDALADALEDGGAPAAELAALDKTIAGIDDLPLAQREDAALALLIDWIARQQRRVVLLIDSSDLLFATLAGNSKAQVDGRGLRAGDADATPLWRLRKTLTHQPGLFWIGASYQALEAEHAYDAAFHDFFQLVELRPLNSEQMRQALLALARTFGFDGQQGDAAAAAMTQRLDARPERLQALRTMTGGNPRTTVILFDLFAANADGNVHSDLRGLLDLMTPLYKARMEALADQPRKLLAHLMEAWAPQTAGELAAVAGLPVTTVSGQLSRLESDGLIEKVRLPGRRRNGYQAGERFFNVWYLMRLASRRLRQRLTWLIEFMRLWFSTPERLGLAQARAERHRHGQISDDASLEYSRALAGTLPAEHAQRCRLEWSVFTAARQNARAALGELFDLDGTEREFATADDYLQRFAALDAGLQRCPPVGDEEMAAWVEAVKGSLLLSLAEKESIAGTASTWSRFQVDALRKLLAYELSECHAPFPVAALAVVRRATLDGQFFPDCPDAKLAYTQLQAAFGDNPAAYLFGLDLFSNRHSDTWVEKAYRRAIELDATLASPWIGLGNLMCDPLQRYAEAEAAYRRAIELDATLASPWIGLGNLMCDPLQRYAEAEAAYRRAIELDATDALPWYNLGNLLQDHLQRYAEAEAAYRRAIELDATYALPWNNLGNLLCDPLQRYAEAEAAYRRAIELDATYALPWNNLGNLLCDPLQRYAEAEAAYRRAIELDATDASPWIGLGNLLCDPLQRYAEAEAAYRRAIELDATDAWPWNNLGNLLCDPLQRYAEAEAAYRRAIELDATNALPWSNLGNLLCDALQRYAEAEAAYRRAMSIDEAEPYPVLNLARLLASQGRNDEASGLYRKAVPLAEKPLRRVGSASDYLALILQAQLWLGNRDAAEQAFAELGKNAAQGDARAFSRLREQVAECRQLGLGAALARLIDDSAYADFLQPLSLALREASGEEALDVAPAEVAALAGEVRAAIDAGQAAPNVRR